MRNQDFIRNTNKIYANLMDDCSKRIYSNRILYNLTGDDIFLRKVFMEWEWARKLVRDIEEFHLPVCIYGAGDFGHRLIRFFPELNWKCFVDRKFAEIQNIEGYQVISPINYFTLGLPVIIAMRKGAESICKWLVDNGVDEQRILKLEDYLSDMDNIYFDLEMMPIGEKEVFADVGVFDGKSTIDFFSWAGCNGIKSYMFEPNSEMKETIKRNVFNNEKCQFVPYGVWDKKETLYFVESDNVDGSFLVEEKVDGCKEIDVVSLDSFFENKKDIPTYIKMDIEGAELKAIEGAKELIQSNKPKLAISIYHKKEDLWSIPNLLLEYRPDYRFVVRHYTMSYADTVLYAI